MVITSKIVVQHTSIGIAREVASPGDEGLAFVRA
jgi:hypothetical protein